MKTVVTILFVLCFCKLFAQQNTALKFDYLNENYVVVPHSASFNPLNNFSIEFWLRVAKTSIWESLINKGKCSTSDASWAVGLLLDNRLQISFNCNGPCANTKIIYSDSALVYGACYHIAITYSSTAVNLYYNGELQSVTYIAGTGPCGNLHSSTQPIRIGTYMFNADTLGAFLEGILDEVRIWNRVLSQTEIQNNYMFPLAGNETGLILYYKMDEPITGPGVAVINHATASGSALNGLTYSNNGTTPYIANSCFVYVSGETTDNPGSAYISSYPNPSGNEIKIEANNADIGSQQCNISVYDISGRSILNVNGDLPYRLSKDDFEKGIYILKVSSPDYTYTGRIIFE
jgi:hypothetical protein